MTHKDLVWTFPLDVLAKKLDDSPNRPHDDMARHDRAVDVFKNVHRIVHRNVHAKSLCRKENTQHMDDLTFPPRVRTCACARACTSCGCRCRCTTRHHTDQSQQMDGRSTYRVYQAGISLCTKEAKVSKHAG